MGDYCIVKLKDIQNETLRILSDTDNRLEKINHRNKHLLQFTKGLGCPRGLPKTYRQKGLPSYLESL